MFASTYNVIPILVLMAALVAGCTLEAQPQRPPPPPTPNPANAVQDLRTSMEQRADHNKLVIDEDVVVWYIPCEPAPAAWAAAMIIYHLPSVSAVYLNNDGTVKTTLQEPRYNSEVGRQRLQAVLEDDALMERIASRFPHSERCPPGSTDVGSQ